ncbi:MAG: ATP-binding protein, partial [Deltaproteobacteria bacterium]|nr:ATP-binding protein [Deltaproteobacteria bacterium]
FPAILVTGARQTGKTTLLRQEYGSSHAYLSLDRPDIRQQALSDPVAFLREHPAPLILDEIQQVPELLSYIKEAIDRDRRPGRWLLTGSQKFPLMRGISETLAGRVAILELGPLAVSEVLAHDRPDVASPLDALMERVFGSSPSSRGGDLSETKAQNLSEVEDVFPDPPRIDLADWLLRGGYPELRLNARVDRQLWLGAYIQTYLERDVRNLVQVGDLGAFSRFLGLVASRSGTLVNLSNFGREVGVSGPTIRRWLSVLETSQIVHLLPPFHRSFGKRIRKSPKLIMADPGLVSFLVGLHDREALLRGPMLGPLTETAVLGEWIKAFRNAGERLSLSHWRSGDGLEVNLVFERGGWIYGVEVKATATPTSHHADALARWLALAGENARGVLACHVDSPRTIRPGIRAVPWHLA